MRNSTPSTGSVPTSAVNQEPDSEAALYVLRAASFVSENLLWPALQRQIRDDLQTVRPRFHRYPALRREIDRLDALLHDETLTVHDPEDVVNAVDAALETISLDRPWFFHGTSTARLPGIAQDGLQPNWHAKTFQFGAGVTNYVGDKVFLTACEITAETYAQAAAQEDQANKGLVTAEPVILRVPAAIVKTNECNLDSEGLSGSDVYLKTSVPPDYVWFAYPAFSNEWHALRCRPRSMTPFGNQKHA